MATRETIRRREYHRQWHVEKREELNERSRAWYYAHREEVAAKTKERMSNPAYREKINADARRTYALRQKAARKTAREEARKNNSKKIG